MADMPFDPEHLETAEFDIVRRGFDPTEVRSLLGRVAEAHHRLRVERDELAGRLAEADTVSTDQLEASRVAAALGVEAAQVLESAHQAAVERAERAEREADAVREEALSEAEGIRRRAREEAEEIVADARRAAEELVDDGRTRGREMVAEAQTVRERMLGDLARKRQNGRAQVEQLKAARDRLLASLTTVQGSLDTAVDDLVESVPEARAAAERAGLRVADEPELTTDQLEAEIEAARLVGHPLVEELPESAAPSFDTGEVMALTDLDDALDTAPGTDDTVTEEEREPVEPVGVEEEPESESEPEPEPESDDEVVAAASVLETDAAVEPDLASDEGPALYDVEAEADADDAGVVAVEAEAEADIDAGAVVADEGESADAVSGVDVVFAKLREHHADADADEPDEAAPTDAEEDPRTALRREVTAQAVKALKKVLVDEQGTLLDGIRRSGGEAVHALVDDEEGHAKPYEEAIRPALVALAGDLGADAVDLDDALDQIRQIALEPVRQRLREVADTEDPDELSDTVRALYRESRSRRLPEAAAAAVVATDGLAVRVTADGPVRWVVEPGGPCGPDCADNELAGEIGPGEPFPTGDLHPPSHAACTCRLVPVD